MSRAFTRVDRELVELAIDLIACGENSEYALSHAAERLRTSGRKGVRFSHVLKLESIIKTGPRVGADARVAGLRRLLVAMKSPNVR